MFDLTLVEKLGNALFIQYIGGGTERTEKKTQTKHTKTPDHGGGTKDSRVL